MDLVKDFTYVVAIDPTSMESRIEVTQWLKERNAVHLFANIWFIKAHYRFAEDITHDFERYQKFDGKLVVLRLNQETNCSHKGLSEEATSWISKNLGR